MLSDAKKGFGPEVFLKKISVKLPLSHKQRYTSEHREFLYASEGAVTHNVLYYQQLTIARYQLF